MSKNFERKEPTFDSNFSETIKQSPGNELPQKSSNTLSRKILKLIGILMLILGVALFSGIAKLIGKNSGKDIGQTLAQEQSPADALVKKAVDAANQQVPLSFDNGMTLVGVNEGPNHTVVYFFEIQSSLNVTEQFVPLQTQQLRRDYCSEKMKAFVENGISAQWRYKHGKKEYVITQTPSSCQK